MSSYADRLAATPSIMPTQGWLSSSFARSRLHPVLHTSRRHEGIDVMAPMGSPIEAPAAGTVREHTVRETGNGAIVTEVTDPNGGVTSTTETEDGAQVSTLPDGTTHTARSGPDPRFGMRVPQVI